MARLGPRIWPGLEARLRFFVFGFSLAEFIFNFIGYSFFLSRLVLIYLRKLQSG